MSFSSSSSSHTLPTGTSRTSVIASTVQPHSPKSSPGEMSSKPKITSIDVGPPGVDAINEQTTDPTSSDNGLSRRRKPKIVIQEEDPIPKSVEKEIYAIQDVIKKINEDT